MDTGGNNDKRYQNRSDAFDFSTTAFEFLAAGEFFADDDQKTGNGVYQAMEGVASNGKRVRDKANNNVENRQKKVCQNKKPARFYNDFTPHFIHSDILAYFWYNKVKKGV